ncbi:hypothetical protein [Carboxylicivirga caseinilyticus]|uniref:hypothetical protein n=1 Tax=Carboxylicivirga caseinilyticus TaxID=3417572 RepID=UPI003D34C150|nr:hypothetical protein [Marinilabiliaceae bacterium A049]
MKKITFLISIYLITTLSAISQYKENALIPRCGYSMSTGIGGFEYKNGAGSLSLGYMDGVIFCGTIYFKKAQANDFYISVFGNLSQSREDSNDDSVSDSMPIGGILGYRFAQVGIFDIKIGVGLTDLKTFSSDIAFDFSIGVPINF